MGSSESAQTSDIYSDDLSKCQCAGCTSIRKKQTPFKKDDVIRYKNVAYTVDSSVRCGDGSVSLALTEAPEFDSQMKPLFPTNENGEAYIVQNPCAEMTITPWLPSPDEGVDVEALLAKFDREWATVTKKYEPALHAPRPRYGWRG